MARSPVGDWLRDGHMTQLWPSKPEGKCLGCFWKDFLSRGNFVVKVSAVDGPVYNPGCMAA